METTIVYGGSHFLCEDVHPDCHQFWYDLGWYRPRELFRLRVWQPIEVSRRLSGDSGRAFLDGRFSSLGF